MKHKRIGSHVGFLPLSFHDERVLHMFVSRGEEGHTEGKMEDTNERDA